MGDKTTLDVRKKLHLPSQMGARTTEIKAVGAWVQHEYDSRMDMHNDCSNAVISAQIEEERLCILHNEKDAKLRQFQDEVRKRVQMLQKLKKQEQLDKSYRAVEAERNVVRQSAFAAESCTPRKNRCTLRPDCNLSIKQNSPCSLIQGGKSNTGLQQLDIPDAFVDRKETVHNNSKQARQKLISRQVLSGENMMDDIPGGVWKSGATRDGPTLKQTLTSNAIQVEGGDTITLELRQNLGKEDNLSNQTAHVPNIYPGVIMEENNIQNQNQRAMYRRLFMDIEREQVKENIRRQQHRKKISQLKKKAEEERKQIEKHSRLIVEPKDPITGETPSESFERDQAERELQERSRREQELKCQKSREMQRFLEALKRNLREKVESQSKELPPLCCCGFSVWDTDPDTCANNCVFYRNPKAYAQALQSLLSSCEVV